jgi:phosphoglycolate phosphatase-like HAD superfamily hydrolase
MSLTILRFYHRPRPLAAFSLLASFLRAGLAFALLLALTAVALADPLPSWNDGSAKQAIIAFVDRVTRQGGPDFVPPPERIATFDNDGTLWIEQPLYVQGMFLIDRVQALGKREPGLLERQPFKAVAERDIKALAAQGEHGIAQLVAATHSGMTVDAFAQTAKEWLGAAKHPRFGRLYTELVYQPQLELLNYLRSNGFKTFIVSGGGIEFMRVFSGNTYGIPPEQVIGSSEKTRFELRDGKAVLVKLPEIGSIDDKEGKPININLHIGRRPILAFGNSDGDLAMLQYTAGAPGPRMMLLLHHDDREREYAYDRQSKVGTLDKALDEAQARGWTIVSMKNDWNTMFPQPRQARK